MNWFIVIFAISFLPSHLTAPTDNKEDGQEIPKLQPDSPQTDKVGEAHHEKTLKELPLLDPQAANLGLPIQGELAARQGLPPFPGQISPVFGQGTAQFSSPGFTQALFPGQSPLGLSQLSSQGLYHHPLAQGFPQYQNLGQLSNQGANSQMLGQSGFPVSSLSSQGMIQTQYPGLQGRYPSLNQFVNPNQYPGSSIQGLIQYPGSPFLGSSQYPNSQHPLGSQLPGLTSGYPGFQAPGFNQYPGSQILGSNQFPGLNQYPGLSFLGQSQYPGTNQYPGGFNQLAGSNNLLPQVPGSNLLSPYPQQGSPLSQQPIVSAGQGTCLTNEVSTGRCVVTADGESGCPTNSFCRQGGICCATAAPPIQRKVDAEK